VPIVALAVVEPGLTVLVAVEAVVGLGAGLADAALAGCCCSSLVASRRCLPVATVAFVAVVPALGALLVVEAVGLGAAGLAGAALAGCCCSSLVASRRCLPGSAALPGVLAALEGVTVPAEAGLAEAAGVLRAGVDEEAVAVCCSSLVASRRCLPGSAALPGVLAALEAVVPAEAGLAEAAGLGVGLAVAVVAVCSSSLVASRRCLPAFLTEEAGVVAVATFLLLLGRWAVPALGAWVALAAVACCSSSLEGAFKSSLA
jgi:hypothetical protein